MASVLIRNVSEETLEKLKLMAKKHNRSLQQELHDILEGSVAASVSDVAVKAEKIRKRLKRRGGVFSDSTELLREDRGR